MHAAASMLNFTFFICIHDSCPIAHALFVDVLIQIFFF